MSNYTMIFSKNLNHLMLAQGKIQQDLINDLGFKSPTISDWCNGKKLPRMDKMQILADYFGVEVTDLLEEQGSPSYLRRHAQRLLYEVPDDKLEQVCAILDTFAKETK